MSRDPKLTPLPTREEGHVAAESAPRRTYVAPRLKRLGSVRDLTLGSPLGKFADGGLARKTM